MNCIVGMVQMTTLYIYFCGKIKKKIKENKKKKIWILLSLTPVFWNGLFHHLNFGLSIVVNRDISINVTIKQQTLQIAMNN